jgi:hypothetical protein
VAPEKKLAILSLNDGVLAGEAAGGVVAGVEAVVAGDPRPPPLHPALSKSNASKAAAVAASNRRVLANPRKVPRLAHRDRPIL